MNASPNLNSLPGGDETILMIEDESPLQTMLQDILTQLGYQVIPTSNGEEALSKFKAEPAKVDLLLADIILPGEMNGLQVAKAFRKIRPKLPICYMTGHTKAIAMLEKCEEAGQWLHKPFRLERLATVIRTALDEA
jgi:DNA-binding NtrC family response regulator